MSIPVGMTLVWAAAYALLFLVFLYLYPTCREPFFKYLVRGWGLFAGLELAKLLYFAIPLTWPGWWPRVIDAAGATGLLSIVAAALAFRGDFHVRPAHTVLAAGYAALVGWLVQAVERGPLWQAAAGFATAAPLFAAALLFGLGRRRVPATCRSRTRRTSRSSAPASRASTRKRSRTAPRGSPSTSTCPTC